MFAAGGKLKKVPVEGGAVVNICDAASPRGASWGDDGTIVFSGLLTGLSRVSAEGGTPTLLTRPDSEVAASHHRWPQVLPGSRAVLFTLLAASGRMSRSRVEVLELATGRRTTLVDGGGFARYVPTGHLAYALGGKVYAAPFDLARLAVTGPAVPIVDDVRMSVGGTGVAHFAYSPQGMLAYVVPFPRPGKRSLVWVDREGHVQPVMAERRTYSSERDGLGSGARLSPDGRRIVIPIVGGNVEDMDLWEYDLGAAVWRRLTADGGGGFAAWAPDGASFAVSSSARGPINFFRMSSDDGEMARLLESPDWHVVTGWSPDGRRIAFGGREQSGEGGWDIWELPLDGDRKPQRLVATRFQEGGAVFSPDGRWIAYASNEGGTMEVYVTPYPRQGEQRWRISKAGGQTPMWSPTGREIFYRNGDQLVVVPVTTNPAFRAGPQRVLFEGRFGRASWFNPAPFDVTKDGQRFLMVLEDEEPDDTPQIVVIPNWFEELKAKVPGSPR